MKKHLLLSLSILACVLCRAQVSTNPCPIPKNYTGAVTITFDPKAGNGGMASATKCYAHTGVLLMTSTSSSDWKHVKGSWRGASQPQLTKNSTTGKWELTIPNIKTFYGLNDSEFAQLKALVFVFHDGPGGSKEGKASGDRDIQVKIGECRPSDIWEGFVPAAVTKQARPAGVDMGIYYGADSTSVTLCTYAAANKTKDTNTEVVPALHVFLLGDMTDWKLDNAYQLKQDGPYFWIKLTGLTKGKEYRFQYAVVRSDSVKKQISDLYSEKVLHPDDQYEPKTQDPSLLDYPEYGADGGYVSVIQTGKPAYNWSAATTNFVRPDKNNLLIYELWVYDYTDTRNFAGLMKRLDYIQQLGVNAIELMPVTEFDGNYNWGYSPNHYFALDKAYGTPTYFKQLVDSIHSRGMAVILDMVFNHATGNNPMNKLYPYGADLSYNPWMMTQAQASKIHSDATYYQDWDHDFAPAKSMFTRALNYWLDEYKVDGFRMDLSHGFCGRTKYDAVDNLNYYYDNAIAPHNAYFILEHWGNNAGTDRPQLVNKGMLCWVNTSNAYCQMAMGYNTECDLSGDANKDGYVTYSESHDEERNFYKAKKWGAGTVPTNEAVRLARVPAVLAFNALLNGPHMLYMYNELGYDYSINSTKGSTVEKEDNRTSIKERPDNLNWFTNTNRMAAYEQVAKIIQLRTKLKPALFSSNPQSSGLILGSGFKKTILWGTGNDAIFVAANFSPSVAVTVNMPVQRTWYDYLNGGTMTAATYSLAPGELKIWTASYIQAPAISTAGFAKYNTGGKTDLEEVAEWIGDSSSAVNKVLIDGKIYIRRDNKWYDLLGNKLK